MTRAPRGELTVLSAFTGLGGLDLGLEAAGFAHLGCIERDEQALRSLKANRDGDWPVLEPHDISELVRMLTPRQLGLRRGDLSVLAGGPPCQPFSKAAQWSASARRGLDDVRSHCLSDFLTLAETLLPEVVVMENVPGFVQGSVSALPAIEGRVASINAAHRTAYRIHHRQLDGAAFGVPQHRVRGLIVICRDDRDFAWPAPTHPNEPVRAWDAIGALPLDEPAPVAQGRWADLLPSIPEGENYLWHTSRGGGRPLFGYRTRFWSFLLKLAKSQPSWTLPAQPGPATGPFHWDSRPLTVAEMLALQSFPPDWSVDGTYREQVRQVGNATPPRLAEVIARAVAAQIFDISFQGMRYRYTVPRQSEVPPPTSVATVPAKYRRLEGKHPDHPGAGRGPKPRVPKDD